MICTIKNVSKRRQSGLNKTSPARTRQTFIRISSDQGLFLSAIKLSMANFRHSKILISFANVSTGL